MADDGKVPRATVLEILKTRGIDQSSPSKPKAGDKPETTLAKGSDPKETLNVFALPDRIGRRMLQYLSRKYAVPIHHFYNPDMALKENVGEKQP